MRIRNMCIVWI